MQTHLEQQGFDGFREAIAANGWQAPLIPSQWYADNRATSDELPRVTAARQLGLTVVRKADDWAPLMLSEAGGALMDKAVRLIDVAEWVAAAEGYGNLLAATHACDVSITGLARFVADLDHEPLASLKTQIERCALSIGAAPIRGRILNYEVGSDLFPTGPGTTDDDLDNVWSLRTARIIFQNSDTEDREALAAVFDAILPQLVAAELDPEHIDPHTAFFTANNECTSAEQDTQSCWNTTFFEALANGPYVPIRLRSLGRLVLFRETIGAFPTEPALKGAFWGDRKQAFLEAWDQHASAENQNLGGAAEDVLRSIEEGTFVDADTRERQRPSVQTAIAQTAAVETETPDAPQTPSPAETPGP